jgi:hypothetical protein
MKRKTKKPKAIRPPEADPDAPKGLWERLLYFISAIAEILGVGEGF